MDTHYLRLRDYLRYLLDCNSAWTKRQRNSDLPFLTVVVQQNRSLAGRDKSCFIVQVDQFNLMNSSADEPSASYRR